MMGAMATIRDIVVDGARPAALARFWAAVLDGYEIEPYDDEEIARLAALGIHDVEDDPGVAVSGPGPRLFFQLVPEPKAAKNRWHVDLDAAGAPGASDAEAEVARIVALGGRVLAPQDHLVTMADPEGNEFCVMR
jgi:hypothetical protein